MTSSLVSVPVVALMAPITDATKTTIPPPPPRRRKIQPVLLIIAFCLTLSLLTTLVSHNSIRRNTILSLNINSESAENSHLLPLQRQEHKQQEQEQKITSLTQYTTTDEIFNNRKNTNSRPAEAASSSSRNDFTRSSSFTVDILSVASLHQLDLLQAQRETFATHISVRNFFNVTENDDADPDCHKNLTWEDVQRVSSFCRRNINRPLQSGTTSHLLRHLRGKYARIQWLQKKSNPVGWLCAQVRPYSGLMKAYHHYRKNSQEGLPDYFIILDDDTYYDMEEFERNFSERNSSEELFYAGCLVRDPVHQINFTFPFGGFGSIFSKGTLRNLLTRIHCPESSSISSSSSSLSVLVNENELTSPIRHPHPPNQILCDRIAENIVGEKPLFKSGMNIVELIYNYVNANKYRDVKEWKHDGMGGGGFCMHSDWVIGYFVNYYNVSRHVFEPYYASVPHARIEAYQDSEIYRKGTGFCLNEGNNCKEGSEICHKVTPQYMKKETDRLRLKFPTKFVTSG